MTGEPFDLDDWLDSVQGETVELSGDGWEPNGLGLAVPQGFSTGPPRSYCARCDAVVERVATDDDDVMGHCVRCGRTPGALELGMDGPEDVDERPDHWPEVEDA